MLDGSRSVAPPAPPPFAIVSTPLVPRQVMVRDPATGRPRFDAVATEARALCGVTLSYVVRFADGRTTTIPAAAVSDVPDDLCDLVIPVPASW